MTRQPDPVLREAVRAYLSQKVGAVAGRRGSVASESHRPRTFWVTGAVAVAVVVVSALVLQLPNMMHRDDGRGGTAPVGGSAEPQPSPAETLPAGKLLGRFTSDNGANQDHTIHPGDLAMATQFVCTGHGSYSVFVAGGTGESGDGGCDGTGGVGSGNGTSTGSAQVKIRTDPDMRWTYTIVGIPRPKQIALKPIPSPTDEHGTPVPYCTSSDLAARYKEVKNAQDTFDRAGELILTNHTDMPCALAGYPEVRFLDHGTPLGHNTMNQIDIRRSTDHGLEAVIVRPGTSAYSQVDWYLPGANSKFEGACVKRRVTRAQIDLHYDLASPQQTGTLTVPIGNATACLNGAHGAPGKYGQISSTVFVDYSVTTTR